MATLYTLEINDNKTVVVKPFKGAIYFHCNDKKNNKSVSFNATEFKTLVKNGKRLYQKGQIILKTHHLLKKKKKSQHKLSDSEAEIQEDSESSFTED